MLTRAMMTAFPGNTNIEYFIDVIITYINNNNINVIYQFLSITFDFSPNHNMNIIIRQLRMKRTHGTFSFSGDENS